MWLEIQYMIQAASLGCFIRYSILFCNHIVRNGGELLLPGGAIERVINKRGSSITEREGAVHRLLSILPRWVYPLSLDLDTLTFTFFESSTWDDRVDIPIPSHFDITTTICHWLCDAVVGYDQSRAKGDLTEKLLSHHAHGLESC